MDHGPGIHCYDLDQITTVPLGEGHALITYRATFRRAAPHRPEVMFVSSIWRKGADGWINIFSQDTPSL